MKQIPNDSIKKWAYSNGNKLSHPVSVATVCPGCSLNVVFNTKRRLYDPNRDTSSCSSDCPACGAIVHFWVVDMVAHARQDGEGQPGIYILPAPAEHMDMRDHEEMIPDSVLQYCKTAQDIYFSGNLMATNVLIKTAMETMFNDFLPKGNSRGELSQTIRDSISTINHNEPLANLSSSTRKDGDLHSLFKQHHGTDQDTADAMMKLLETLIMYLYVLPARFKQLESSFADMKSRIEPDSDLEDETDYTNSAIEQSSNAEHSEHDDTHDHDDHDNRVNSANDDSHTKTAGKKNTTRYKHLTRKRDDGDNSDEDQVA